jgi:quercetin dioxygenase-like cupin family protein
MPNFTAPFAVQPGEGPVLETPTGDAITVKADTMSTNGSLTVLELLVAPGSGPARHIHVREDELWWVLEGDFRFKAFGPRGVPHNFQNIGDAPGRLLIVTSPSGVERFFEQFAALPGPVDAEALAAVGHANWIEFIGPPLAISDPL